MENSLGFFGKFGGAYVSDNLKTEMQKIQKSYNELKAKQSFISEMKYIRRTYQGRPTPISYAKNLSQEIGGAKIYFKREDLNHTGSHKLNHCIGEVLLAKYMGKKKVIAETGAGQHGVAMATASAYLGIKCDIYMGAKDIVKEKPNVQRMQLLGAKVISVEHGQQSLKEAVDSAFEAYLQDVDNSLYCIGSVVGPHPFPSMIRDYQMIIGEEAKEQMLADTGNLPNAVVACVGGGSNAIGIFSGFINDTQVALYGVEPLGKGTKLGSHAAAVAYGKEGIIHGFKSLVLMDNDGNPAPVYSIASGLDYPSVGPEHAYLHTIKRVKYVQINDEECLEAFYTLPKKEGIIPALESAHAVAYGIKLAKQMSSEKQILINLSGRGDKDIDFVMKKYGLR
ncbi:MAG: tryptophan synthase subunit beta [Alphaproteobacteria bacterium]|nr:tryptophan synthase subunit beta [Alphaproteobacteria bacterium]